MKHPVLDRIKRTMEEKAFAAVPAGSRILAAVSGGADSVCLMLSLRQLGYDVCAVHVEHGIRGEESLEDCAFVRKLCEEQGIALTVVPVNAPSAAQEFSLSLEEAARLVRWKALMETSDRLGIRVIATAHHRTDQAETVLWNLIRGSSLTGLGGIRAVRQEDGRLIIRPMIDCERGQIEDYLRQRKVSWQTDSTNADTRLTRNAIRRKVLPLLEELNPQSVLHITQAASDLQQAEDWLSEQTESTFRDVIRKNGDGKEKDLTADRNALRQCPDFLRARVLRRMIAQCEGGEKDIARAHVAALEKLVDGPNGGQASLPDHLTAFSEEGILRLTRSVAEKTEEVALLREDGTYCLGCCSPLSDEGSQDSRWEAKPDQTISAEVSFLTWQGGEVPKKRYTKYLAYDTMAPCPVLRTRREGDYLIVSSDSGRKKLKDYLIDEKVPRLRRDHIPLIAQGSHVLWVVGMRISEKAKVFEGAKAMRVTVHLKAGGMESKEEL